jgi:cellulose synthase/poly-beta-1,6-N-acetylglucosamine synthase-like glycosyltransferase
VPGRHEDDKHNKEHENVSSENDKSHIDSHSSHSISRHRSAILKMPFTWPTMSGNSARKLARLLILVLSVVLFSASTALHFTNKESLAQFFVSLLALIPVSVLVQFAAKDITLSLQQRDYEFLSGFFSGILGY